MSGIVFLNGDFCKKKDATVSIFDQGFLRGDGLFETIRATKGKIPFLKDHLERFYLAASLSGMVVPFSQSDIAEKALMLLQQNDLQEAKLRLVVTRGVGESMDPVDTAGKSLTPTFFMLCEAFPTHLTESFYEKGVSVVTVPVSIRNELFPTSIKSTSYFHHMAAKRYSREQGAFEAILTDAQGNCLEGSTSNLFWIRDKKIFTTPLNVGALPGVTRKHLVQVLHESDQSLCEEKIHKSQLAKVDELFMTSSIVGILPVIEIDRHVLGEAMGPMTKNLRKQFATYLNRLCL